MTERENGQTRALQERSLFQSQQYATSVYRSELAMRLQGLGYEVERGQHGQPEIKGYTQEYLDASSPRREQIKNHLQEIGMEGAGAAQVAAHRTRDSKEIHSPEVVLQRHRELAAQHGHQADRVVAQAREHAQIHTPRSDKTELQTERQAVTYARNHVFERSAVQDERSILQAAISRSMAQATYEQVRHEFAQRVQRGEFVAVGHAEGRAAPLYTTSEMVRMEQEIIGGMQSGNQRTFSDPMLVSSPLRIAIEDRHTELSPAQREVVDDIFVSREKIVGLDGIAGTGKTTTLAVIREGAEAEGYKVEGFAPSSRAAQKLAEAGIDTSTLQRHLARGEQPDTGEKKFYVLDESSLASTRQMHEFMERLHATDRVLLVGDTRQHEAVEAGRPFAQLQEAGMRTVRLEEIVRQKDPELKQAVEQLARGQVGAAIHSLDRQGRVHEVKGYEERISAIAREYAKSQHAGGVARQSVTYRD
jgi:molybdopterin-guanine dinucleotide biosynthesis protein